MISLTQQIKELEEFKKANNSHADINHNINGDCLFQGEKRQLICLGFQNYWKFHDKIQTLTLLKKDLTDLKQGLEEEHTKNCDEHEYSCSCKAQLTLLESLIGDDK